jgi:hypothetical protein
MPIEHAIRELESRVSDLRIGVFERGRRS